MKAKKNIAGLLMGSLIFALLVAPTSAIVGAQAFSDVSEGHENFEAIDYLRDEGIVEGYVDGNFKPDNTINRAEFLKIVMGAGDYVVGGKDCYPDVRDQWFSPYVCKATELGLVKGYDDKYFRPEWEINFAEASKIVAKALNLALSGEEGEVWYEKYVEALEVYNAIPKTISSFEKLMTRGEMSEMIWRVKEQPEDVVFRTYDTIKKLLLASESGGELQTFASCVELKNYLEENTEEQDYYMIEETMDMAVPAGVVPAPVSSKSAVTAEDATSEDFSATNVQVEGVDEADIVKNDGRYIYLLKGSTVRVVEAYPPGEMAELDRVTFDDGDFYPADMYVDDDRLVIIGTSYSAIYEARPIFVQPFHDYGYYGSITKTYIFDVSDRTNIELTRQISFEGDYFSSRKVDEMVYVVVNKSEYRYVIPEPWDEGDLIPLYSDSASDSVVPVVGCADVLYYPGGESTNYLIVVGIPVDDAKADVSEQVVLGSSGDIYASRDNLYVAESKYSWWNWGDDDQDEETIIHKFDLDRAKIEYLGNANVPGTILNQFSMDEYVGNFRIATTLGEVWNTETPSTNNLYILDENLKRVGSIEGIAPGEQIHSVRFMGDRAYMVTFKKIDPFFVIDVSSPSNPKILGKLKIPGYSDYLHPYDENHIIGFGKEAVEASEDELRDFDFAWYQGIKVAMFDVTDVSNPVELHKIEIGDRGTDSQLLWNHKALLFDKSKGLMAFPVTLAEIPQSVKDDPDSSASTYGDYIYQGAYVYDVSIEDGFTLKGRLTHYAEDEIAEKAGYYWYGDADIDRILYIGNYIYTVSQAMVMANEMADLDEVNSVDLAD